MFERRVELVTNELSTKEKAKMLAVRVGVVALSWVVIMLLYVLGLPGLIYDAVFNGSGDPGAFRLIVGYLILPLASIGCIVAAFLLASKEVKTVVIAGVIFVVCILPFVSLVAFEAAK